METLFAICPSYAVDEGRVTGFLLVRKQPDGSPKRWPILIARNGNQYFGFENACPHEGGALDRIPGEFMDEDENFIECGTHQAKFDLDSGLCFIGPCKGQSLTPIELVIDDGDICLRGIELVEEDGLDIADADEMPEIMITSD